MANWSELPCDILGLFAIRLPFAEEFVRFGCVCKSWRSAALEAKTRRKPFGPWLMLSNLETDKISGGGGEGDVRGCYSFISDKIFNLSLPELQGRRCWGTQYGWIITLGLDSQIHLFNPLTKAQFSLPPQTAFAPDIFIDYEGDNQHMCQSFLENFALASNPSESGDSVLVMAMVGERRQLAFASPKDTSWTTLDGAFAANDDVVLFDHRFYSVTVQGALRVCDINTAKPESIDIAPPPPQCDMCGTNVYLVEISGDLHMIVRSFDGVGMEAYATHHVETVRFYFYKFDFHRIQWIEVEGFESHSLFVGNNTTFAIPTSRYPEFNLKPNCIYFTDDRVEYYDREFCDMGVYDIGMKSVIEPFYKQVDNVDLLSNFSRPFFFMSTLA